MGRVQAQFQWQNLLKKETNWIRVKTPDGGSSQIIEKNRGYVFIPEPGDEVMIDFEGNDPSRPYCSGSLFSINKGEGGRADNHLKTIITKSGHMIAFNDAEASLSITIKDRNENIIHLDTVGKNIDITAPETITLTTKNIRLDAEENITTSSGINTSIQVGNNLIQSVDNDHITTANKSVTTIDTDYLLNVKKLEQIADKVSIDSSQKDMDLISSKKVNIQSSEKVNLF